MHSMRHVAKQRRRELKQWRTLSKSFLSHYRANSPNACDYGLIHQLLRLMCGGANGGVRMLMITHVGIARWEVWSNRIEIWVGAVRQSPLSLAGLHRPVG